MSDDVTPPFADEWPEEPEPKRGYVAESFGEFFGDRSWLLKSFLGGLVLLVPLLGLILVYGYGLRWMRLTAWGMDDGLPPFDKPEQALATGWRAFLVRLAWAVASLLPLTVLAVAAVAILSITSRDGDMTVVTAIAGLLVGIALLITVIAVSLLLGVAVVRSAMYERFGAGLNLREIRQMISANQRGFLAIIGVKVLGSLMIYLVESPIFLFTALSDNTSSSVGIAAFALTWVWYIPTFMAVFAAMMIGMRAYGRWIREIGPSTLPAYEMAPVEQQEDAWNFVVDSGEPFSDADD